MINTRAERFGREGYCLFSEVLDRQEAGQVREMLNQALVEPLSYPTQWHQGQAGNLDRPGYVGEPHARDRRWLELCRHPRILDAVEAVLGPNLVLVYSSVFIKLPGDGVAVGWHQDNNYWPSVHGTDVVTLWLAIDDADVENCAMEVIPGSQREYREYATVTAGDKQMLSKKVEVGAADAARAVALEMGAGSLSIHDSYILHGSRANSSNRRRAGYTIRYCSSDTAWVDVEAHPIPVYLVRGVAGERGRDYIDLRPEVEITPAYFF